MLEKIRVSIVTPAYNAAGTLMRAYDSVRSQTFDNWEWIIVDDGSTDETLNMIEKLKNNDCRVKAIFHKRNEGAAKARNDGIACASGDYVAFLDADDIWMPQKLQKQLTFMIQSGHDFTCTAYEVILPRGNKTLYCPKTTQISYRSLLTYNCIGCLTVMYKKSSFPEFSMPLNAPKREDHAAWLSVTRGGTVIHCLNEALAVYYNLGNGVSSKKISMIKYQYNIYRRCEGFSIIKSCFYLIVLMFNKLFRKGY